MRSKKSQIMLYVIFIFFIAALFMFYFYKEIYNVEARIYFIGEDSLEIIKSDTESQKDLVYIDNAAKLSVYQSIFDLALNGGYSGDFPNGKFNDFVIWKKDNYPDYKSNFKNLFNSHMNIYLLNFKAEIEKQKELVTRTTKPRSSLTFQSKITELNYELLFDKTSISGFTQQNLEKRIDKKLSRTKNFQTLEFEKLIGFSLINPSFNIDMGYDIDKEYNELISNTNNLIVSCQNEEDKPKCINEKINYYNNDDFEWSLTSSENNLFAFSVKNKNTKVIATDSEGNTDFKDIVYKFALDLSPKPSTP